jgi:hypothetical protein
MYLFVLIGMPSLSLIKGSLNSYGIKAAYSIMFFKTFYQGAIEELDQYTNELEVPTFPLDIPSLSGAKRRKNRVDIHAIDPKFKELNQMYWEDDNATPDEDENYDGTFQSVPNTYIIVLSGGNDIGQDHQDYQEEEEDIYG